MDSYVKELITSQRKLQIEGDKDRVINHIKVYIELFNKYTVINNNSFKDFKANLYFTIDNNRIISFFQNKIYVDIEIPVDAISADDFENFIFGVIDIFELIQITCLAKNVNVGCFTFKNSYYSWDRYLKRIGYDENHLIDAPETHSVGQSLRNNNFIWCYNQSCAGKTYSAIYQLKNYSHRLVYNPCFQSGCDYELIKVLLCFGQNIAILIDDIQCDFEKAKELFSNIDNLNHEFYKRNIYVFLVSWASLLKDKTFLEYSKKFPAYSTSINDYIALLKFMIKNKNLLSICADNIALLHAATRITLYSNNNGKEILFKTFVKTNDKEKLQQIYRLCVLGTYELTLSQQDLGFPSITSDELNTLKIIDSVYYAGHREICQFVATYIENTTIRQLLPKRQEIIHDFIIGLDNSQKWKTLKRLIGETGSSDLKAVSPIWNTLHCFEQEILRQTEKDPSWGNTPSSMYFVLKVTSLLGVADEYRNVLDAFCNIFTYTSTELSLKFDIIATTNDFEQIKQRMIEEDKINQKFSYESGLNFVSSQAHKNWCLGLIVGLKNELLNNGYENLYQSAVDDIFKQQDPAGFWYPKRIPWVTARIVIGLTQAGYSITNEHIKKAVEYLLNILGDDNCWDAHTGGWNSVYETSSLCLEAIYKSNYPRNEKINRVIQYLVSQKNFWMIKDKEVDGSATACCLLKMGRLDSSILDYINSLCDGCIYDIVQENSKLDLVNQQSCKITQIAWYTTDLCWHIFEASLPSLLSDFIERSVQNKQTLQEGFKMGSIFISYCADSTAFVSRVRKVSDRLKQEGYTVYFYNDEPTGTNLPTFMRKISDCDLILVMGTKHYKEKAIGLKEGGVFFENLIISELFMNKNFEKVIPIAFDEFSDSFPPPFDTNKGLLCKRVTDNFLNTLINEVNNKLGGK